MTKNEKTQEAIINESLVENSNNRSEGNAGRDIVYNHYGMPEEFYKGNSIRMQDVIKSQRAVIERLQWQIDRMQDEIKEHQRQYSRSQTMKEKLMDMLLDDRRILMADLMDEKTT